MSDKTVPDQMVLLFVLDLKDGMKNRAMNDNSVANSLSSLRSFTRSPRNSVRDSGSQMKCAEKKYGDTYSTIDNVSKMIISLLSQRSGETFKYKHRQ